MTDKTEQSNETWAQQLTPEQYRVCRQQGTERAFTGAYNDFKEPGVYRCTCCDAELFRSTEKFDSGTGWPSFFAPASVDAVETESDNALLMRRTEVHCKRCKSHLGHVFDDGPKPTGQRYCINSVSLKHEKR